MSGLSDGHWQRTMCAREERKSQNWRINLDRIVYLVYECLTKLSSVGESFCIYFVSARRSARIGTHRLCVYWFWHQHWAHRNICICNQVRWRRWRRRRRPTEERRRQLYEIYRWDSMAASCELWSTRSQKSLWPITQKADCFTSPPACPSLLLSCATFRFRLLFFWSTQTWLCSCLYVLSVSIYNTPYGHGRWMLWSPSSAEERMQTMNEKEK